MGTELPMVSAVMARMPAEKINLAAYAGVVFPLALIIEAPIIMLLAASTALSKDWQSYRKLRQFMHWAGGILTGVHIAIAFTPLFYPIVVGLMKVPTEIVEASRLGLMIMIPWTWSIAYRRFNQGVLIRFGHSNAVGIGTAMRLAVNAIILGIGFSIGSLPGIAVGTLGIAAGVIAEAVYIGIRVQPVLKNELKTITSVGEPLTWTGFSNFYWPLAVTSLLNLIVQPVSSAAISRMPDSLNALAVLGPINGFIFMFRSMGFAYNEVVIRLVEEPNATRNLRRFMSYLALGATLALFIVNITPLAGWILTSIFDLSPELTVLGKQGLWVALLFPAITILLNWYQGVVVASRQTIGVTESIILFMVITGTILLLGVRSGDYNGLYVAFFAFQAGYAAQSLWLGWRSRQFLMEIKRRDLVRSKSEALVPVSDSG